MRTTTTDDYGLRLTSILASHHMSTKDYKERHSGIGLQYKDENGNLAGYMKYTNSYNKQSHMVHIGQEWKHKLSQVGWVFAGANGYASKPPKNQIKYLTWDGGRDNRFILGLTLRYKIITIMQGPGITTLGLTVPLK